MPDPTLPTKPWPLLRLRLAIALYIERAAAVLAVWIAPEIAE
jgi:hypothetical protein